MKKYPVIILLLLLGSNFALAQKTIRGTVRDSHSEEPVPFASIQFQGTALGTISDSAGNFGLSANAWPSDTLTITRVGFQPYFLVLVPSKNDLTVTIPMDRGTFNENVVVKVKIDKGLWLWKKIVQHKPENNRYKFDNFSYELYNKLEVDLKNFKSLERISNIKPFRPIHELINQNIDSLEGQRILPTYLTETISDYYYQKKPLKRREEIIAVNTNGVKNESIVKFLGGMDQVFNVYNNFINVFNKEFVSPISDNGDFYYKYYVTDTQYIGGSRYYRLLFTPRRKGMNTFEGDCWVHVGSFAIWKMNLSLDKTADINFMERFSFVQEFKRLADSSWFVSREKMVVDVSPLSNKTPGVIGHKTSTYRNIVVNDSSVTNRLARNKQQEEVIVLSKSDDRSKAFWDSTRHEPLSRTERGIIRMIDTLINTPSYQKITRQVVFLTTGYFDVGNVQFGSAYNWFSGNGWEGFRTRFDLASNKYFNKALRWHTYLAYGFTDRKVKGEAELFYLPRKDPRQYWHLGYRNDLDFGQNYYGEISQDNIFTFAIRKPNIPRKYINLETTDLEFFNELRTGFSAKISLRNLRYTPLKNLMPADSFGTGLKQLVSSEIALNLRFAYQEKFLESQFYRTSLGSPYPIVEGTLVRGFSGLLGSRFPYTRLLASVSDNIKTPPFGSIAFQLYTGRTFGTLPYTFLEIAPGNELYYYNKYAFNMMSRYEYVHDRFAGLNYEHIIGNGIFRLLPRLKVRQFYTVKALWGLLSDENKLLNNREGYHFKSLDGKTYMEVGTGLDNILKFLRVDFIWRVLPTDASLRASERFGIFGSFRINF